MQAINVQKILKSDYVGSFRTVPGPVLWSNTNSGAISLVTDPLK